MGFEWTEVQLADVCEIIGGFAFKSPHFSDEGDITVIKIKDISTSGIEYKTATKVFTKHYETKKLNKFKIAKGDFVVAMTGATIGKVGKLNEDTSAYINQRVAKFDPRENVSKDYLYFCISGTNFQEFILSNIDSHSAQPNISGTSIGRFPLLLPDYDTQKHIAKILSDLDDKIILNTQINQTLEAMAQALFKSWFVDFDPVRAKMEARASGSSADAVRRAAMAVISGKYDEELVQFEQTNPQAFVQLAATADLFPEALVESELGLIPEGWEVGRLEDLLDLSYGKALKKTDRVDGDYPVYGSGGVTGSHIKAIVKGPGVIVGRKGTVGSLYWEDSNFYPIDTVFYVEPKNKIPLSYLFYLLQTLGLQDMNTDAAVPGLNRNNAYRLEVVKSSSAVLSAFGKFVNLIRNKISALNNETKQLTETRDTLLPKLLSGEIDLSSFGDGQVGE